MAINNVKDLLPLIDERREEILKLDGDDLIQFIKAYGALASNVAWLQGSGIVVRRFVNTENENTLKRIYDEQRNLAKACCIAFDAALQKGSE